MLCKEGTTVTEWYHVSCPLNLMADPRGNFLRSFDFMTSLIMTVGKVNAKRK